jgi:(R,R)-butanediol dehydrogenase / meso-butanediol dehydrogenase / diacetyl reductase
VKAAAFAGPGRLELREIAEPTPAQGEVVVDVAYCGVCGSDLHEYASDAPSMRAAGVFQPVMGHEFTGVVSALGPGVNGLAAGDPVVVHPGGPCGDCYFCRSGAANLCAEQVATGYRKQGAYAERVAVDARQASRLPDASILEAGALAEPLA